MQVETKIKNRQLSPLASFLGEEASVISCEKLSVNNFIICEMLEVCMPESNQPEDMGRLYLYPVDDNKFCLQLYFQLYSETSVVHAAVCSLRFLPPFFDQYPPETLM